MKFTRSGFIRGLAAGTLLLPTAALAKSATANAGAFCTDLTGAQTVPWTARPASGASPLRFAVIGDRTGLARPGVFEQGIRQISWLQPDFILSVGDMIEGYTQDRTEIARQWAAVDDAIAKAGVPFVHIPGNHDVNNAESLDAWRQRRGPGHYSFTYKGALFIVLNTEDTPTPMPDKLARQFYGLIEMMKRDPEKTQKAMIERLDAGTSNTGEYSALDAAHFGDRQLGFLRDTLLRHPQVRWTFVVMHKPAWKKEYACFAPMQALLKGRPYTVIAGHTHYFTHETIDGADYINMGTTGGIFNMDKENGVPLRLGPGTMDHAMLVSMASTGPAFANLRLNGLMDSAGNTGQTLTY